MGVTGGLAFLGSSVFFARPESWAGFAFGVAWLAAGALWMVRTRWTDRHVAALASGALLTYAWGGFALTALTEPQDPVRWWGNAALAAGAVALVVATMTSRKSLESRETSEARESQETLERHERHERHEGRGSRGSHEQPEEADAPGEAAPR